MPDTHLTLTPIQKDAQAGPSINPGGNKQSPVGEISWYGEP
jgi:hypothetical protein